MNHYIQWKATLDACSTLQNAAPLWQVLFHAIAQKRFQGHLHGQQATLQADYDALCLFLITPHGPNLHVIHPETHCCPTAALPGLYMENNEKIAVMLTSWHFGRRLVAGLYMQAALPDYGKHAMGIFSAAP